jgi:hypothetical protein
MRHLTIATTMEQSAIPAWVEISPAAPYIRPSIQSEAQ